MTRAHRHAWGWLICVFTAVLAPAGARSDTPGNELLKLVPEDVGICMIVQDLRDTVHAVRGSAFLEQIRASALGKALNVSPEIKKLRDVEHFLRTQLDVGAERLLDDILGDAIVLAYWPGPPGKPEEEQGVVMVRARDPQLLASVLDRLPAMAQHSGNAPPRQLRVHNGASYAAWHDGKKTVYSYVNGPIAAITHHERLLKRVISRERETTPKESPISKQLQRLGLEKALAAVWFNARAFDAEVETQTAAAPDLDPSVRAAIQMHWKAVEGMALTASLGEKDLSCSLAVLVQSDKLPPASRLFFRPGQISELWSAFPEDAMLTVAGRVDTVGLTQMLGGFLDDHGKKTVRDALDRYAKGSIGRDVEREVFPALGPDWGFAAIAPPKEEKGWHPYFVAALRIQPGTQEPPLDQALANFLNGLAMLAVVFHNSSNPDALSLHTEMQDKVEVKYFVEEKNFPVGFRPAFAMKNGYLVVASSPAAVRMFSGAGPHKKPASSDAEIPWVRISPLAMRQYLADRANAIAAQLAAQNQIPLDEASNRVNALREILGLLERIELTQRSTSDQFHLTLRIRAAHSLRK